MHLKLFQVVRIVRFWKILKTGVCFSNGLLVRSVQLSQVRENVKTAGSQIWRIQRFRQQLELFCVALEPCLINNYATGQNCDEKCTNQPRNPQLNALVIHCDQTRHPSYRYYFEAQFSREIKTTVAVLGSREMKGCNSQKQTFFNITRVISQFLSTCWHTIATFSCMYDSADVIV